MKNVKFIMKHLYLYAVIFELSKLLVYFKIYSLLLGSLFKQLKIESIVLYQNQNRWYI